MSLKKLFKTIKGLATGAFINPWRDETRARILIIGTLGNFALGAMSFALNYTIAAQGIEETITYHFVRLVLLALVAVPFTFWFLERYQSRWLLLGLQTIGLGLFSFGFDTGAINALMFVISFGPFLALHSYRFAKNQSRDNRGNEIALNSTLIVFAYSFGIFFSGLALEHGMKEIPIIGGYIGLMIGSFFLYYPITARNNLEKVRGLIGYKKPSSRITFFNGMFSVMVDGCMPIWMQSMGISPLGAGVNMSLRPMIGMALTPLVGRLIQKGTLKAGQLGGGAMILAWLIVAASLEWPWALAFGMAVLTSGSNLVSPMELGRWFKRRSSAGVISREIVVTAGRLPAFGASIAVSFLCPALYPVLGLAFSGLFIWAMRPRRRGLGQRIKEVVGLE